MPSKTQVKNISLKGVYTDTQEPCSVNLREEWKSEQHLNGWTPYQKHLGDYSNSTGHLNKKKEDPTIFEEVATGRLIKIDQTE